MVHTGYHVSFTTWDDSGQELQVGLEPSTSGFNGNITFGKETFSMTLWPQQFGGYHISPGTSLPILLYKVEPELGSLTPPTDAEYLVYISINADGSAESGYLRDARTGVKVRDDLVYKVREFTRQWRFQPAMKNGKPIHTDGEIPISFRR
jgi:hypothetical protein